MRRVIQIASRLYPHAWRERYGDEFTALLEDAPARWLDVFDVMRGGLAMQMSRWRLGTVVAAFGIFGALSGLVLAFTTPRSYTSKAALRVESPLKGRDRNYHVRQLLFGAMSRRSLSGIIQEEDLYPSLRAQKPLEDVIEQMRHDVRLNSTREIDVAIEYLYEDPVKAKRATQRIVQAMMTSDSVSPLQFQVVSQPSQPAVPNGPNRLVLVGYGLGLGIAVGILIPIVLGKAPVTKTAILMGLAGAFVGAITAAALPHSYLSTGTIHAWVHDQPAAFEAMKKRLDDVLTREYLAGAMQKQGLYRREREKQPLDDVVGLMRRNIVFENPEPGLFRLGFVYPDPILAQGETAELIGRLMSRPMIREVANDPTLEVVDPAELPVTPIWPNHGAASGAGAGLGIVAGVLWKKVRQARGRK